MEKMAYTKGKKLHRKEHFTGDIDQDPKKQLVIDVKLVIFFKSNVSVQQSSSLLSLTYLIKNRASRASKHYLHVENFEHKYISKFCN